MIPYQATNDVPLHSGVERGVQRGRKPHVDPNSQFVGKILNLRRNEAKFILKSWVYDKENH